MSTNELEFVYSVENGKLMKFKVQTYNPDTCVFTATSVNRCIRGSLDESCMFFKTAAEAVTQEYTDLQEIAANCREEVYDALAMYKAARKAASCTMQELVDRLVSNG